MNSKEQAAGRGRAEGADSVLSLPLFDGLLWGL